MAILDILVFVCIFELVIAEPDTLDDVVSKSKYVLEASIKTPFEFGEFNSVSVT